MDCNGGEREMMGELHRHHLVVRACLNEPCVAFSPRFLAVSFGDREVSTER